MGFGDGHAALGHLLSVKGLAARFLLGGEGLLGLGLAAGGRAGRRCRAGLVRRG